MNVYPERCITGECSAGPGSCGERRCSLCSWCLSEGKIYFNYVMLYFTAFPDVKKKAKTLRKYTEQVLLHPLP